MHVFSCSETNIITAAIIHIRRLSTAAEMASDH